MKVTYLMSVIGVAVGSFLLTGCDTLSPKEQTTDDGWTRPAITDATDCVLSDTMGAAYEAGLHRLTLSPFDKDFLLADINFNQKRWFTNFSGDISGRFTEVASEVSKADQPWPEVLPSLLDAIPQYQKEDGHFGVPIDWSKPIDFDPTTDQTVMMPTLWGNGRLLLGLTAAARKFDRPEILETAKKLGDFYVNTVYPRFCDPNKMDEYKTEGQYASAYVTCVFEGMEGLLNLYYLTNDKRYLETACKMADFHEPFDTLPVGHSHGSLSQTSMLVRLYDATGKTEYLDRAVKRWDAAVSGGYVNPAGSVLEKFYVTGFNRDEGCSEGDWLRLNLLLWADTGETKYLDMAERLLWNGIMANQWDTGGFGHRFMGVDDQGAFAYLKYSQESLWCCSFHLAWAEYKLLSYLAPASDQGICYNFPLSFETTAEFKGSSWNIQSKAVADKQGNKDYITATVTLTGTPWRSIPTLNVRVPEWADSLEVTALRGDKPVEFQKVVTNNNGRHTESLSTKGLAGKSGVTYVLKFGAAPYLEDRRFHRVDINQALAKGENKINGIVIHQGPFVYMNRNSGEIQDIALDEIQLKQKAAPYYTFTNKDEPHAFVFNLVLPEAKK